MEKLLIWDSEGSPPTGDYTAVLWRDFGAAVMSNGISIPRLIEENAEIIKARYLAWVYELGELNLYGKRLVDHLQLHPSFSYWWMTLLVEKCNYSKSPQIYDAIRLIAFSDWVGQRALDRVTLVSANQTLAMCLRSWCEKYGVAFDWQKLSKSNVSMHWSRHVFSLLPVAVQALVWLLKYLLKRWPLRGVGLRNWQEGAGSITFVSYLFNLVPEGMKVGRHESHYWGTLPEVLRREGYKINWLHLYSEDAVLPNAKKAAAIIKSFNKRADGMELHVTLDTFLTVRIVFNVLSDWIKLSWNGERLKELIESNDKGSLELWPLFVGDWRESTCGITAMSNALYRSLFDAAMKVLPKQQIGCYLQENQGWEFALIQTWRIANHGRLIGVPHSSVRFWDLRYFFDPRNYRKNKNELMPLPDQVALNGNAATDAYLKGGYPSDDLIQVEALRYLYLSYTKAHTSLKSSNMGQGLRLLVLGDYLARNTQIQMRLLAQAAALLPIGTIIIAKPHPACHINAEDYPELRMRVTNQPLIELLPHCDVVFTSAVTSAAVDAYCAGVPVVSTVDPTMLNMSPLRGYAGVFYVGTPTELIRALQSICSDEFFASSLSNIFTLSTNLPRWRKLFADVS